MPANTQRLEIFSGWKEIANYLGKGVRTVQRYESQMRLPVHRPAARACSAVIATKVELDAWVTASPVREVLGLTRRGLDQTSLFKQFSLNVERMNQLRSDIQAVREEFSRSLALLRQNLRYALPAQFPSNHQAADVLIFDPKKKAN